MPPLRPSRDSRARLRWPAADRRGNHPFPVRDHPFRLRVRAGCALETCAPSSGCGSRFVHGVVNVEHRLDSRALNLLDDRSGLGQTGDHVGLARRQCFEKSATPLASARGATRASSSLKISTHSFGHSDRHSKNVVWETRKPRRVFENSKRCANSRTHVNQTARHNPMYVFAVLSSRAVMCRPGGAVSSQWRPTKLSPASAICAPISARAACGKRRRILALT